MTKDGDLNGNKYLEHKPGFTIKENSLRYWCEYLKEFPGWEKYVPDSIIFKLKSQAKFKDVDKREGIIFDSKFLLSVLKTLNSNKYGEIIRRQF